MDELKNKKINITPIVYFTQNFHLNPVCLSATFFSGQRPLKGKISNMDIEASEFFTDRL